MTGIGIDMALGSFVSGWVVDTFGPNNGFWVTVIAGFAAFPTVLLGQRILSGRGQRAVADGLAQPAE